jgi:hypothetical protein
MKLYTEEQVKGILIRHINYSTLISLDEKDLEGAMENSVIEILNEMTSIELPSDDEICDEAESIAHNYFVMQRNHYQGLEEGAKRMAYWLMKHFKQ